MSTHWGYHCQTHDESTEHWLNHGEANLRELWSERELLKGLRALDRYGWEIQIRSWTYVEMSEALHFVQEHADCNVVLENEYGNRIPIEPTPPCGAAISINGVDRDCQLGKSHYSHHRYSDNQVTIEWA